MKTDSTQGLLVMFPFVRDVWRNALPLCLSGDKKARVRINLPFEDVILLSSEILLNVGAAKCSKKLRDALTVVLSLIFVITTSPAYSYQAQPAAAGSETSAANEPAPKPATTPIDCCNDRCCVSQSCACREHDKNGKNTIRARSVPSTISKQRH